MSGRAGFGADLREGAVDLKGAFQRWRLWTSLALHDVAARYRGSVLGPWWITVSMAGMIVGIGALYSQLFGMATSQYVPWLAAGLVFWSFMSTVVVEGCDTFISSAAIIRQTSLPILTFILRMMTRNLINFAHQIVIVAVVLVYYGIWMKANPVLSIAGFLLVLVNLCWLALVCGIASTRFRDVTQIITALVQVTMFLTPVFWRPDTIRHHRFVLDINPFYHMLEVTRRPLLGEAVSMHSYAILIVTAVLGWIFAFLVFSRTRRRMVHYL